MATLKYADLLKRDNINVFLNRDSFQLLDSKSDKYSTTNKMTLVLNGSIWLESYPSPEQLDYYLNNKLKTDYLEVGLSVNGEDISVRLSSLLKDKEFGGIGDKVLKTERQEQKLIEALKIAAEYNAKIPGLPFTVTDAWKNKGLSQAHQEPYVDIYTQAINGMSFGISCKADTSPSLAGGGIVGLKYSVPRLVKNMYDTLETYLKVEMKLPEGAIIPYTHVPDIFMEVPTNQIKKIFVGNEFIGGPIDYMYIGKMDVNYTLSGKKLNLNGRFYNINEYIKKVGRFYFRVRKREIDSSKTIQITYKTKNKEGFPMLFRNPKNGKSSFRLVVDSRYSKNGILLPLKG